MTPTGRLQLKDASGRPAGEAERTPETDPSDRNAGDAERLHVKAVSPGYTGDERGRPPRDATASPAVPPSLSPELVSRFHALVDEVTDELMQDRGLDRRACRADAIALLVATSALLDDAPPEHGESPLMYLLLEEQQRAAAVLDRAGTHRPALTFMKV